MDSPNKKEPFTSQKSQPQGKIHSDDQFARKKLSKHVIRIYGVDQINKPHQKRDRDE